MAKFQMEVPDDLLMEIRRANEKIDDALGEMTRAGAETAAQIMSENAPKDIKGHIKISKTYKTPSDGAINTKVYIAGYIPFSNPNRKYFTRRGGGGGVYSTDKGVPADFLAKLYEYGRSTAPFPKRPFVRKSLMSSAVRKAVNERAKKIFDNKVPFEIDDSENPFV